MLVSIPGQSLVTIHQLIKIQVVFRNMLDYGAVGDGVTVSPMKEKTAWSTRTPIRVHVLILTYPLPGDRMIQTQSRAR